MAILEFRLPPGEADRLLHLPDIRRTAGRAAAVEILWHDTADGTLAEAGISLSRCRGKWRLEQAGSTRAAFWPPASPAPCLAEAADLEGLGELPGPIMPVAGFRGHRRLLRCTGFETVSLTILDGVVRGVAEEQQACRVELQGDAPALMQVSTRLAAQVALEVPRWPLGTEAVAFVRNIPMPVRASAPEVPPGVSVSDAIVLIIGHLADMILAGAPAAALGETAEPVHALRVAVRRLRSALSVFRKAADCPEFGAAKERLHHLAGILGAARDWDVFLAGVGHDVAEALPNDTRIEAMLAAAQQHRERAYAALRREFASPGFRTLCVLLAQMAVLRPWEFGADAERMAALSADAGGYAAALLTRRHEHMLNPGPDIATLPVEELHELRKQGKRLRYAAEFFAPIYGRRSTRRFVRSVSRLQEALGHLNDGSAAGELMKALRGGAERHFAAGAVQGFAAARGLDARAQISKSWAKFRRTEAFWD